MIELHRRRGPEQAADWVAHNLAELLPEPPQVTEGEVSDGVLIGAGAFGEPMPAR